MKQEKIEEIVTLLIENGVKAQDVYFHCKEIFEAMVIVEHGRMGLITNKHDYKYEAGVVKYR